MKRAILPCLAAGFLASAGLPAQAQVTIDVRKITCEQWLTNEVSDPDHIAIWLSGYVHGKRDDTVFDVQALKSAAKRMKDVCFKSFKTPLMEAAEREFGPK